MRRDRLGDWKSNRFLGLIKFIEYHGVNRLEAHSIYSLITEIGYWIANQANQRVPKESGPSEKAVVSLGEEGKVKGEKKGASERRARVREWKNTPNDQALLRCPLFHPNRSGRCIMVTWSHIAHLLICMREPFVRPQWSSREMNRLLCSDQSPFGIVLAMSSHACVPPLEALEMGTSIQAGH